MDWYPVHAHTYEDPHFLALTAAARSLFLWALVGPESNAAGLFHATRFELTTGMGTGADLDATLAELEAKPLMLYDEPAALVWIINKARYANRSPKVAEVIRRQWQQAPRSPLRDDFANVYGPRLGIAPPRLSEGR